MENPVINRINNKLIMICFHNLFLINNNKNKIGKNFIDIAQANGMVERVYFFRIKRYINIKINITTKLSKFALSIKNKNGNVKNVKSKVFENESLNESDFIKV
jgi:hypothetical protein